MSVVLRQIQAPTRSSHSENSPSAVSTELATAHTAVMGQSNTSRITIQSREYLQLLFSITMVKQHTKKKEGYLICRHQPRWAAASKAAGSTSGPQSCDRKRKVWLFSFFFFFILQFWPLPNSGVCLNDTVAPPVFAGDNRTNCLLLSCANETWLF